MASDYQWISELAKTFLKSAGAGAETWEAAVDMLKENDTRSAVEVTLNRGEVETVYGNSLGFAKGDDGELIVVDVLGSDDPKLMALYAPGYWASAKRIDNAND